MSWLKRSAAAAFVAVALFLTGCESPEKIAATKDWGRPVEGKALELLTDPALYPDFRQMYADKDATIRAIDQSLIFFSKPSSQRWYPYKDYPEITHARVVGSLEAIKQALQMSDNGDELNGFMVKYFDVYRSVGWDSKSGDVLFTGYCQLIYDASRTPDATYKYPLYKKPDDLVKDEDGTPRGRRTADGSIVPYYSREEIDGQGLLKGQELVYLKSRLDAYIVHVNGSAQLNLPGGEKMYIGYAGKTDREYKGLGVMLVEDGKIPKQELSLPKIRDYFAAHPEEADRYMNRNESYVFFTETGPGGPYGSIGVAVTPYRTLATDKAIFPRGAPCGVATQLPEPGTMTPRPFVSFACDQDTGGAIRSAGRCDIFVGTGPGAEAVAGHTQYEGHLYYFFVKPGAPIGTP
jgi:membrane-bound lytic murein transglycosylase A